VNGVFEVRLAAEVDGHCGMLSTHGIIMRGVDPGIYLIS
jgi:hypothetical protein